MKEEEVPIDWKDCLMRILNVVSEQEGVLWDDNWERHGISASDREVILQEWEKYPPTGKEPV